MHENEPVVGQGRRREGSARLLSDYSALLDAVRAEGLLRRHLGFYWVLFVLLLAALALIATVMFVLGDSWWQLLPAAALGVVFAQYGFLAHEAAHREIFQTVRANDHAGRLVGDLLVGISYAWWKAGHNRHHANPNLVGKDPSVARGVFSFTPEDAALSHGMRGWLTRHQGFYFYPLLPFAGLSMHVQSIVALVRPGRIEHRGLEAVMLAARWTLYPVALLTVMSPGRAVASLAVQTAVFGVTIASAFVPNHVGMPVLPAGTRLDFLRRQVVTSRNIRGPRWLLTAWMGGLNYQIEHHLFPSMPRPALHRASSLTREYCAGLGIPYTDARLFETYALIARHLDHLGRQALAQPARCPVATRFGR